MNAKEFIDRWGVERARQVAELAGTNYSYFSQIAYGHRRPSVDLANRLVEASGHELEFVALLQSKKEAAA